MTILRTIFIVSLVLTFSSFPTYADSPFSKVVVFGDSNVDSGEADEGSLYNLSGGVFNGPPNVGGRNCNGPVVVEYVANSLGVPLENYGVSGAMTSDRNIISYFIPPDYLPQIHFTGVLSQLQEFEDSLKNKADPRALYIYWAGSNDLLGATEFDLLPRIETALENIENALIRLTDLGARYILVATRTARPEYYDGNNVSGVILNARIRVLIQQLNDELRSKIQIFEAFDLISDMAYNPDIYGFVETINRCILNDTCINDPSVSVTYMTWDDAHKTTRVHEIMAENLVFQALNMKNGDGKSWGPNN